MNANVENLLRLIPAEVPEELKPFHLSISARARSVLVDAETFMTALAQVTAGQLKIDWERAKAAYRAQRAVVEQAVANAGAIEAQLPAAHRVYGEARLAVQSYSPEAAYDPYASAEALAEVTVHRGELEKAVTAAAEDLRRLEQQIILSKGWASFEQDKLNELAAAEESIRIQVGLAQDPGAAQFNSHGLTSGRPAGVLLSDFGLSVSSQ
jgi:hypothetical protein